MDENGNQPLPSRVVVFDTETTGLHEHDRIVTLGAVRIENGRILTRKVIYGVFDPRRDCHPAAAKVHGWDDWTLRHQDLFADHALGIHAWFSWADILVAHNASFDMRFLQRELRKAGQDELDLPVHCTMQQARGAFPGEKASLDAMLARFGLARAGKQHGALEDALLTACLFLKLNGVDHPDLALGQLPDPVNLKDPLPRPPGKLPRREAKRAAKRTENTPA
jgi:DNA polymerase-3 subunit epsilon